MQGWIPLCHIICFASIQAELSDVEVFITDSQSDEAVYIHVFNSTSKVASQVRVLKAVKPMAVAYDSLDDRLYWSDVVTRQIRTSRLDGTDEHTFRDLPSASAVEGLAIDAENRLLFYTDKGRHEITSVSLKEKYESVVIVNRDLDNNKPRGITLFPDRRLVLWTDLSVWPAIKLCDYTGNNTRVLVHTDIHLPNGVTLDRKSETVYWCDAGNHRVEAIQLDGTNRIIILTDDSSHYYSVVFFEHILYLTDWNKRYVRVVDLKGTPVSTITGHLFKKPTGLLVIRVPRCAEGRYGGDCEGVCHCTGEGQCNKISGHCIQGCAPGYYSYNDSGSLLNCNESCTCPHSQNQSDSCRVWATHNCTGSTTAEVSIKTSIQFTDVFQENRTLVTSPTTSTANYLQAVASTAPRSEPKGLLVAVIVLSLVCVALTLHIIMRLKKKHIFRKQLSTETTSSSTEITCIKFIKNDLVCCEGQSEGQVRSDPQPQRDKIPAQSSLLDD